MISCAPIKKIRIEPADKVPHPPERKESHYLVIETEWKVESKIGDRVIVQRKPDASLIFPVDKHDIELKIRRLLKELQQA